MKLIENGRCAGCIIISQDADAREVFAAGQLRYYLQLMTGLPVKAYRASEREESAVAVIGSALPLYGETRDEYDDDELRRFVRDGRLFLDGGERGLLYAVYDFLESVGCRFFTPSCEKVPTYTELEVPDGEFRQTPIFHYREFYYRDCLDDPLFAAKCRVNGHHVDPKYGRGIEYGIFVHSFARLIPYDKYHDAHPEWFALWNGTRESGGSHPQNCQLCLSNPEVIAELTEQTRLFLRAHPEAEIMSLSQNDGSVNSCQCDACRAIDEEEGSPAGLMLRAVNAVAEALEEEFPKVRFETLAYTYTRRLPRFTRPRRNVNIRLCTIECCFFHPLSARCDHEYKQAHRFADDLEDWSGACENLYIWDYVTSFHHYMMPHPNWRVLQPDMQFFAEHHVRGVFSQGNKWGGADLEELRCYLMTHLLWDPWCDTDALTREFTDYYYGAAGPIVREYIEEVCRCCEETGVHIGCYQTPLSDYFEKPYLDRLNAVVDRAEDAVRDDPRRAVRIAKLRLSLRYTALTRGAMAEGRHDAGELNRFICDSTEAGITHMTEGTPLEMTVICITESRQRFKGGAGVIGPVPKKD